MPEDKFDEFGVPIKPSGEVDDFGIPVKKKVPTPLKESTGTPLTVPKKKPSRLDQLISQDWSSVLSSSSEQDLEEEKNLETDIDPILQERKRNAAMSLLQSVPRDPQTELPQGLREKALLPETQKKVNKLSKKLELSEAESVSFANPVARTTGKEISLVPSELKGVDFWDTEYANISQPIIDAEGKEVKKGFDNYVYTRDDGLLFDKLTQAPVVLKKVMDDYMNFIQKTQPDKFKFLSYLDRGELSNEEAQALFNTGGRVTEYLKSYVDPNVAGEQLQSGKSVRLNQPKEIDRYKLIQEALNHQSVILNQDYEDMKEAGVAEADAKYARGRQALEDLSKNILQSFPGITAEIDKEQKRAAKQADKQAAADTHYQLYLDRGGFWNDPEQGLKFYIAQPVAKSLQNFAGGWLTLPRELGVEGESPFLQELVKLGETVSSAENVPDLSSSLQESMVPQIVRGISDMSLLLLGTKGLGSVKAAGYKPSMFANSFALTHDNYYQEAKNAGLTDDQASEHAARSAALTSALEFVSPNQALLSGFKQNITSDVAAQLAKGVSVKNAWEKGAKDYIKQLGQENAQEVTQLLGDKLSNYYTNTVLGKSALDTEVRSDEILNTLLVTTAVTGLVTAPTIRNKSGLQRDMMYTAAINPVLSEKAITDAVETDKIDKWQAETLRKKLTDYKTVIDGLPATMPEGVKPKMADLIYQKKLLTEQKEQAYVDPLFKNQVEAEQLQAEEDIDNEIKTTFNDTVQKEQMRSPVGEGQTIIQTGAIQETGAQEIGSGGIFQEQETVDSPKQGEDRDTYVKRMVEEHKSEGDIIGPEDTEFTQKFYEKKWMDKFGPKTQPVEENIVLNEQQIEEPYGTDEATAAFEDRTEEEINRQESAIQALESAAADVGNSKDRSAAAELYRAAGDLISQAVDDIRTRKGYTVKNEGGKLTAMNPDGEPVKSSKVKQAVLRNYKNTLKVINDSGTLRVVDPAGAEVTGKEYTENLIQKYKESFSYDQGRTSIEVAEEGDPVLLSENPMELAAIGTPEAAAKFQQLTGVSMEEYNAPKVEAADKTLRERFNKSIDEFINSLDKNLSSFIVPPQVIKAALRTVKAAVNAGFTIDEAIKKGVETIKKSQWFKKAGEPEEALQTFSGTVDEAKRRAESNEPIERAEPKDKKEFSKAKKSRKQISKKIRVKQKGATSVFANDRSTLKEFVKLDPREVSSVEEYNSIADRIKESLNNPVIRPDGSIKRGGRSISNNEISQYIDKEERFIKANRDAKMRQEYKDLLDTGMSIEAILAGEIDETLMKPDTREQKRQAIKDLVDKKLGSLSAFVKLKEEGESIYSNWTPEEQKVWDSIESIDTDLPIKELVTLNNIIENVATNESLDGAGKTAMLSDSQKIVPEISKLLEDIDPGKITKGLGASRNVVYSLPIMVERITLNTKKAAELNRLLGLQELFSENTRIDKEVEKIANEVEELKKGMDEPNSLENRFKRGTYAFLIRNKGGDLTDLENEFQRKKSIVEDQINVLTNSTDTALKEQGELLNKIYTELGAKEATTYDELTIDPSNKKIVDKFIEEATKFRDALDEHSRLYNNQGIVPENNYTSISYKNLGEQAEEGLADIEASAYNRDNIFQGASRTTLATKDNWSLPKGKILNLDFDNVQARKIREALYQIGTQNARTKFSKLINNPDVIKALGGEKNKDALLRAVKSSVEAQLKIMPYRPEIQLVNKILDTVSAKGTRIALASLAQPLNQIPSVWMNAVFNLGLPRAAEMVTFPADPDLANPLQYDTVSNNLFKYGTLLNRKSMRGGYQRQLSPDDIEKAKKATYKLAQKLGVPKTKIENFSASLMNPLIGSDYLAARRSWMAYYKKFRQQDQGVKGFDWQAEAANPDPQASAYAEQMLDRTQNISDYSKQGKGMRRTGGPGDILKNVLLPFSGFAVNQRARMYNDLSKIRVNPGNTEAYRSLGGTIAEVATFNAIKLYVIYWITSEFGSLLASAMGFDAEDKEDPDKLLKFGAKSTKDLLFSGMGSMVEHWGTKGINAAYKELAGSDKDIIPIYTDPNDALDWQQFGLYGSSLEAADEMARDFKAWWTGETPAVTKGGPKFQEGVGQLTDREQTAMGIFGLYEMLKLAGVSDQLLNSAMRKAKSRVDKQIKEREGVVYQTEMGIPGEAYKPDKSEGRVRKKRTEQKRQRRDRKR